MRNFSLWSALQKDADPGIAEVSLALETHWRCEGEAGWAEIALLKIINSDFNSNWEFLGKSSQNMVKGAI
jgi:hypothetical protein